tara:strand:+ start:1300 stop:1572 length:273 start_codon:yes stop_codon:yes gene_type:complete
MKLIDIKKSNRKNKKWVAEFDNGDKIHYGDSRYLDFTIGATEKQKEAYLARHDKEKNQPANTAGALSYHILWQSRSMKKNIESFKKKYNV